MNEMRRLGRSQDWGGCVVAQHSGGADKATFGKNQLIPVMVLWAKILGPMACLNSGVWMEAVEGKGPHDLCCAGRAVSLARERSGEIPIPLGPDPVSELSVAL